MNIIPVEGEESSRVVHKRREVVVENGEVVKGRLGSIDVNILALRLHETLDGGDIFDPHLGGKVAPAFMA